VFEEIPMKLFLLSCGRVFTEKGFLWHWGTSADNDRDYEPTAFEICNTQYFIDHPRGKVLFEAGYDDLMYKGVGFPRRHRSDDPNAPLVTRQPDENPPAQLAKIGVSLDDIDYVVMSHLMTDHAGWLPAFAGKKARIIVQEKEFEYASRLGIPPRSSEPEVEQFHTWMYHRRHFEVPGLNYQLINGDLDLFGKDIQILSVPGHTPGYQAVVVRLPNTGTIVLSSCEILPMYYATPIRGYAPGIPHSFSWFAAGELYGLKRLRELAESENGQIFCGHDLEQFLTLRRVPEYYD
jgi:N-acyl homoserine lactone hydrolase